jgi:hypothetical protein
LDPQNYKKSNQKLNQNRKKGRRDGREKDILRKTREKKKLKLIKHTDPIKKEQTPLPFLREEEFFNSYLKIHNKKGIPEKQLYIHYTSLKSLKRSKSSSH